MSSSAVLLEPNFMSQEWEKFAFVPGEGSSRDLTTVRHVVHVQFARRIIEDGKIKAGLIYDESRLNKSRISVAWVSANTWVPARFTARSNFNLIG